MIDLHAHVLPGVDDGPADLPGSLALLREMAQQGIRAVVASPHAFDDHYTNTGDAIRVAVERLQEAANRESIPIQILPGMELRLRPDLPALLRSGQALSIGGTRFVCVELPPREVPYYTERALYELMLAGWRPILNHPERNRGIQKEPQILEDLVDRGLLAMVSAGSLLGHFGSIAERLAKEFIRTRAATMVVSDAHGLDRRAPFLRDALEVARVCGKESQDDEREVLGREVPVDSD